LVQESQAANACTYLVADWTVKRNNFDIPGDFHCVLNCAAHL